MNKARNTRVFSLLRWLWGSLSVVMLLVAGLTGWLDVRSGSLSPSLFACRLAVMVPVVLFSAWAFFVWLRDEERRISEAEVRHKLEQNGEVHELVHLDEGTAAGWFAYGWHPRKAFYERVCAYIREHHGLSDEELGVESRACVEWTWARWEQAEDGGRKFIMGSFRRKNAFAVTYVPSVF